MAWEFILSGVCLSLILLIPLGIKWEIPMRLTIPASLSIGIFTGLIIGNIPGIDNARLYFVVILQLLFIAAVSAFLVLWRFYRDPEREPPNDRNAILSPADGKIIYIKRIEKGTILYSEKNGKKFSLADFTRTDLLPTEGYLIGISMTFLNVHVNRAPIDGKISLVKHITGRFISLKKKEAVVENERALTVIDNGQVRIGIVQIASRLVRSIILYLHEGHAVQKGERIGMIRFGSQVDLILPSTPSLTIEVILGQEVKAGLSIVARMGEALQKRGC